MCSVVDGLANDVMERGGVREVESVGRIFVERIVDKEVFQLKR